MPGRGPRLQPHRPDQLTSTCQPKDHVDAHLANLTAGICQAKDRIDQSKHRTHGRRSCRSEPWELAKSSLSVGPTIGSPSPDEGLLVGSKRLSEPPWPTPRPEESLLHEARMPRQNFLESSDPAESILHTRAELCRTDSTSTILCRADSTSTTPKFNNILALEGGSDVIGTFDTQQPRGGHLSHLKNSKSRRTASSRKGTRLRTLRDDIGAYSMTLGLPH
ncbi:hypothetical protein BHE74_00056082 [Ensete ventricosum]|nr:hypothetical protein BHE74_00056082 [Ensete ventricosum]